MFQLQDVSRTLVSIVVLFFNMDATVTEQCVLVPLLRPLLAIVAANDDDCDGPRRTEDKVVASEVELAQSVQAFIAFITSDPLPQCVLASLRSSGLGSALVCLALSSLQHGRLSTALGPVIFACERYLSALSLNDACNEVLRCITRTRERRVALGPSGGLVVRASSLEEREAVNSDEWTSCIGTLLDVGSLQMSALGLNIVAAKISAFCDFVIRVNWAEAAETLSETGDDGERSLESSDNAVASNIFLQALHAAYGTPVSASQSSQQVALTKEIAALTLLMFQRLLSLKSLLLNGS